MEVAVANFKDTASECARTDWWTGFTFLPATKHCFGIIYKKSVYLEEYTHTPMRVITLNLRNKKRATELSF
jgi:hypothetical protein